MSAQGLWPQAEGALCRATTSRIQRYVWMQEKWYGVAGHVQVALVHIGDVRKSIQILYLRTVGVMHEPAVLAIRNAKDFFQRFSVRVLDHGVVEFFSSEEVNRRAILQRFFR